MRPDLTRLRAWDPVALAAGADRLATGCRAFTETTTAVDRLVQESRGYWSGDAADAASGRSNRELITARRISASTAKIVRAIRSGAGAIGAARTAALAVADSATAAGLSVSDTGRVAAPRVPPLGGLVVGALLQARLNEYARVHEARLSAALDTVAESDRAAAVALRRAHSSFAAGAHTGGSRVIVPAPPRTGSPESNARYWSGLSPEQRREVLREHPDWVGNRDGIPAWARDEANRSLLTTDRNRLERRIEELCAGAAGFGRGGIAGQLVWSEIAAGRARLGEIGAVARSVGRPRRQLLVYRDAGEHLQAAVAIGDVDTADHVSVFTPGVNSNVAAGLEGSATLAAHLKAEAEQQLDDSDRAGETVAAVAWLDYRAPQLNPSDPLGAVTDAVRDLGGQRSAEDGAERLASFYAGVNASRAEHPHLTALGHSYGSTTTGLALQRGGTGVDDAVFFGSPGIGTDHVGDLGLASGHVYVAEAHGDQIADLAAYGGDPNRMDGVVNLSTSAGLTPQVNGHAGELRVGVQGHSRYLDDETLSQYNIGAVVGGLPGRIVEGTDSGIADRVPGSPLGHLRELVFGGGLQLGDLLEVPGRIRLPVPAGLLFGQFRYERR